MKCTTCRSDFYPVVSDSFTADGVRYREYVCPWCEEKLYYPVKKSKRFSIINKISS
jgi:hypothetical protein